MELLPSWFVKASAIWGACLNYPGEGSGVGSWELSSRPDGTRPRVKAKVNWKSDEGPR